MHGQGGWRRILAQDMFLHLSRQLERLMREIPAAATAGRLMEEWRTANQFPLGRFHQALPQGGEAPDAARIQFLIGLIASLSPFPRH